MERTAAENSLSQAAERLTQLRPEMTALQFSLAFLFMTVITKKSPTPFQKRTYP